MGLSLKNKNWEDRHNTAIDIPRSMYLKIRAEHLSDLIREHRGDILFTIKVSGLSAMIGYKELLGNTKEISLYVHEWQANQKFDDDNELDIGSKKKIISFTTTFYADENQYDGLTYENEHLDVKLAVRYFNGTHILQTDGRSKFTELMRWFQWEFEKLRKDMFEN